MIKCIRSHGKVFAPAILGIKPKFQHDCDGPCCAFHGRFWPDESKPQFSYDVWISSSVKTGEGVLILRDGSKGESYNSMPLDLAPMVPHMCDVLALINLTDELIGNGEMK